MSESQTGSHESWCQALNRPGDEKAHQEGRHLLVGDLQTELLSNLGDGAPKVTDRAGQETASVRVSDPGTTCTEQLTRLMAKPQDLACQ